MSQNIQARGGGGFREESDIPSSFSVPEGRFIRDIVFDSPDRIVDPTSWVGHIPFAFWLVDVHRPSIFVELGTHTGNSYSAFAQAIQRLKLATQCYAVDTWSGDEHSGLYSNSVFEEFSRYHDARYRSFSRLLRTTFEEARKHFNDGSIDLLHVDGLHTFDAVKHDFDTWLPKLSPRGVVLLHDINVREDSFGVWKLWSQLSKQYPHFRFDHSHGLGVLGVGRNLGPNLRWLFGLSEDRSPPSDAALVRAFFSGVGGPLSAQAELVALRDERKVLAQGVQKLESQLRDVRLGQVAAVEQGVKDLIALFDTKFYQANNPGTTSTNSDALLHYLDRGWKEGRQPTPWFDTDFYLEEHPDVALFRGAPLVHYVAIGASQGWQPHPLFDPAFYKANIEAARAQVTGNSLVHYLEFGQSALKNCSPHLLFDAAHYKSRVKAAGETIRGDPVLHFLQNWSRLRINPHPLFDADHYFECYSDVRRAGVNPLIHYIRVGRKAGLQPSRDFNPEAYLGLNADVAHSGMDPFDHYVRFGLREGRRTSP